MNYTKPVSKKPSLLNAAPKEFVCDCCDKKFNGTAMALDGRKMCMNCYFVITKDLEDQAYND